MVSVRWVGSIPGEQQTERVAKIWGRNVLESARITQLVERFVERWTGRRHASLHCTVNKFSLGFVQRRTFEPGTHQSKTTQGLAKILNQPAAPIDGIADLLRDVSQRGREFVLGLSGIVPVGDLDPDEYPDHDNQEVETHCGPVLLADVLHDAAQNHSRCFLPRTNTPVHAAQNIMTALRSVPT